MRLWFRPPAAAIAVLVPEERYLSRVFSNRFGLLFLIAVTVLAVDAALRTVLLLDAIQDVAFSGRDVAVIYLAGLLHDLVTCSCGLAPLALYALLAPDRVYGSTAGRTLLLAVYALVVFASLLLAALEWGFWDEFASRFNSIAVDCLVYAQGLVGVASEAYPLKAVLSLALIATALFAYAMRQLVWAGCAVTTSLPQRLPVGMALLVAPLLAGLLVGGGGSERTENRCARELAKNGASSLVSAFATSSLDPERRYAVRRPGKVALRLRELQAESDNRRRQDTKRIVESP
jgi:hypothetical protein